MVEHLDKDGVYNRPRKQALPGGVMPRKHWIENRADDILEAMERYRRDKYIIPPAWVEELAGHLRELERIGMEVEIKEWVCPDCGSMLHNNGQCATVKCWIARTQR